MDIVCTVNGVSNSLFNNLPFTTDFPVEISFRTISKSTYRCIYNAKEIAVQGYPQNVSTEVYIYGVIIC